MEPCPSRRHMPASDILTSGNPPMSPDSSGELSPFDLSGDIGDICPGSPTDDGLEGNQQDGSAGQKWDNHTEIAEQAKHEAEIENRIAELRKEGFWTPRRLSKFPEPTRPKVQWDYLCEEMQWLSADFGQERRWKRGVARKVVRMVVRHHEELKQKEERARREEQAKLRRIANSIAKEVRQFWSNVEKVVQFKQQSRLEEKRKKALDLQLDFIVGQTEKYSDLLSQSLSEAIPVSKTSSSCVGSSQGGSVRTSPAPSVCQKAAEGDGDFLPHEDGEDDEETIEMEEQQEGNDAEAHRLELELLRQESELPLDELLQKLPPEILQDGSPVPDPVSSDEDTDEEEEETEEEKVEEEDDEFTANEDEAEDEEGTIAAEEEMAGQQDHAEELSQLAREGEMSLDELLLKYSVLPSGQESTSQSEHDSVGYHKDYDSSYCDSSECESEGVEFLVKQDDDDPGSDRRKHEPPEPKEEITDIAATAESLQPKGYTLATTQVKTAVPFLLHGDLREYQHIGLEWLVTMYEKKLNGILADEMGLGKTIQTISLLAHLACERGNWGPHLIIVPTSVILNWEMELKRWCPSFKILTYYGSQKERKLKRQGWTKANAFHVCITSYKLVLQDHQAFRRKNWKYLILDEAQNIKNFKSQRWQSLLNFNSQRRLLLTGTPLQNSLMELWSLMHFLMPHVFQSHREFKEWFSNPLTGMIEGSQEYNEGLVRRLHKVLRPFLLRRLKLDVEKQMPKKYEHVIYCRLSMRQRFLYDDFMSQAATRETLASGHFMSVINILMQLRKVCNHPNLFDPRPIHSPFITSGICYTVPSLVLHALQRHPLEHIDMSLFDLINMEGRVSRYERDVFLPQYKQSRSLIQEIAESPEPPPRPRPLKMKVNRMLQPVKPDPRSVLVVNNSRPIQKPQDVLPPCTPQIAAPPSLTPSNCAVPAAPLPALNAPLPVQPSPAPTTVTPVPNGMGKSIPVQNSQTVCAAPQRLILTPDMQARLPSGEVISLAQLASLGGRPLQNQTLTKPLTLQLQGAKFTLSGAPVRPLGVGPPRPMQGNVLHLVSSGGQHHLLSQPTQLALIQALTQQAASSAPAMPQLVQNNAQAQIGVQAMSVQSLQHTLLNNANLQAASPGQAPAPGVVKIVVRQSTREIPAAPQRHPVAPPVRPLLRVVPGPCSEASSAREGAGEQRAAPVVSTSTLTLASSPLLMMSSPALTTRLASPHSAQPSMEESPGAPVSGVALRLLTTSAAVQLPNHHSSPRHTYSPALPNCSPAPTQISNCTSTPAVCPDTQAVQNDSASVPLLEGSASDSLPSLVLGPALKLPSPMPLLSGKMSIPIVNATSAPSQSSRVLAVSQASSLPLLAAARSSYEPVSSHSILIPAPIALASLRHSAPVTTLTFTTSCSPLSSTSTHVPAVLTKLAPAADVQAPEPTDVSSLQPVISGFSQAPLPCLSLRIPAPQPSLPVSTQPPAMPASAPAPMPSMPASTPIPLPLLPASTPAPMSSLPASSLDTSSLLLVPAPAPNLSSISNCAQTVLNSASTSLLPPATHPLVISFSAPLTLTASSPSLGVSAHSHIPVLSAPVLPYQSSTATLHPTVSPKPAPSCAVPLTAAQSVSSIDTKPVLPSSALLPASTQEPSLSLSVADPPIVSVTLGSTAESDSTMEGDDLRPLHNAVASTCIRPRRQLPPPPRSPFYLEPLEERRRNQKLERLNRIFHLNERRSSLAPVYGTEVLRFCTVRPAIQQTDTLRRGIFTAEQRLGQLAPVIERFIFAMPPVEAPQISLHTSHPPPSLVLEESVFRDRLSHELTPHTRCLHRIISNMRTQFPDLRLIQYDCGKLQTLDSLLRQLKSGGHRVLLFTQMTRMLDVLEQFLNYHGHIYLRLDGSTRVEQRQVLMERFNMDRRIFCFILSTRSGGVGVNLTGADTVIFYDSDWNPTMDAQAQDRCHRIGQTRDVHIYRLVSERTVEENILKKAQQKRLLGDMAIEGGNFTTAYFKQHTIRELFDMEDAPRKEAEVRNASPDHSTEEGATSRQAHILEQALCGAEDEEDTLAASLVRAEQVADLAEFNENVPLEPEEEEQSRAEQEISALVEQLTPIERYAMYYLEASLEEVSKEELKQAEEQVEAARKDLFLAKDEGGLMTEEKWDEETRRTRKVKTPLPNRPPERVGVRMSERLRGSRPTESLDHTESLTIPDTAPPSREEVECDSPSSIRSNQATPEPDAACPSTETSQALPVEPQATTSPPCGGSEKDTVPETELEKENTEVTVTENVVDCGPLEAVAVSAGPVGAVPVTSVSVEPVTPVGAVPVSVVPVTPIGAVPVSVVPVTPIGAVPVSVVPVTPVGAVPVSVVPVTPVGAVPVSVVPVTPVGAVPVSVVSVTPVGAVPVSVVPVTPVGAVPVSVVPVTPVGAVPESVVPVTPVGAVPESVVPVTPVGAVPVSVVPVTPVGAVPVSVVPVTPMGAVPVEAAPEDPAPPRTPRRKVFADCEITLAGATETSPTAKVLRRLPGRLVTVVQERLPTPRRQNRGRDHQTVTENDCQNPNPTAALHSPSHDRLSEETSETGSPPPKRKRGRPPKTRADLSPTSVPIDVPPADSSPDLGTAPPAAAMDLVTTSVMVPTPGSPNRSFKVNSDCESGSPIEKRKRGRPPKRRDVSPIVASPMSPKRLEAPPGVAVAAPPTARDEPSSSESADPSASSHKDQVETFVSGRTPDESLLPSADSVIPNVSSNIPAAEGTSSSGVEEPVSPPKRKRGRPPKSRPVITVSSSPTLDSSPERSPSPQVTRTSLQRKCKPLAADGLDTREQKASLADTDDSSEEEVTVRTPLTRSARTQLQTPSAVSSRSPRGRSPRATPALEKPPTKKRKPPSASSPSPSSSSPHGSPSESRKRPCPPAERVLRSSLTANPASNTRSSRPPIINSPSSHRGRKAKT